MIDGLILGFCLGVVTIIIVEDFIRKYKKVYGETARFEGRCEVCGKSLILILKRISKEVTESDIHEPEAAANEEDQVNRAESCKDA